MREGSRSPFETHTGAATLSSGGQAASANPRLHGPSSSRSQQVIDLQALSAEEGTPGHHSVITPGQNEPPKGRKTIAGRAPCNRSRVANGSAVLTGVDARSTWARRYRDLIEGLTADLGEPLTEAERQQVRTAASLQLHVEQLTAAMVNGQAVDTDAITRAGNGATRALGALHSRRSARKPKSSAPSLADIAAQIAGASA